MTQPRDLLPGGEKKGDERRGYGEGKERKGVKREGYGKKRRKVVDEEKEERRSKDRESGE